MTKFYPDLRDTTTPQSLLTDVTSLEQALIDSSPPPGSKVAKVPPPPKPNNMHYYYDYPFEEMQKALEDHAAAAAAKAAAAAAAANGADTVASTSAPGTPGADGIAPTSDSATAVEGTPAAEDGTEGDAADGADAGPTLAEQTPAAAPLLIEIIKRFESNLHLPEFENSHGRRDWFSWLVRFVNKRLAMYNRGGFDWHYNLLKRPGVKSGSEREQEFWLLKWHDKVSAVAICSRVRRAAVTDLERAHALDSPDASNGRLSAHALEEDSRFDRRSLRSVSYARARCVPQSTLCQ